MQFENPANGYVETCRVPFLWALIFGPLYFVLKGVWRHVILYFIVNGALISGSWFFAFFGAMASTGSVYLLGEPDGHLLRPVPIASFIVPAALILPFLFYPFIAGGIVRRHYLRMGWTEIE
jgi:hypothetical protein